MIIVIAWTETAHVWDGKPFAADMGRRPRMIEQTVAKACTWLLSGTEADKQAAKAYVVEKFGSRGAVFAYPETEQDPLGRAKKDILK